jgi:purine-nucleoside phosphorylase
VPAEWVVPAYRNLYELFTEYDVDTIIRIGTCGAYNTDLKLFDILNVENAASESTYAKYAWEIEGDLLSHQGKVLTDQRNCCCSVYHY